MEIKYSPHFSTRLVERFNKTIHDLILTPSNIHFMGWGKGGCYKIRLLDIDAIVVVSLTGIGITIYSKD